MHQDLTSHKVIITGITGGIARETARLLLSLGAEVIVSARSQDKLDAAINTLDGNVSGYVMDLTNADDVAAFFGKVGAFDHLVTPAATGMFAPVRDMDWDAARALLDSKQWGQMLCVHHGAKHIKETGSITLFSGTVTQKPLAGATMFAAAGAATEAAGRIWAFELAPVRVNTIAPGVIDTGVWAGIMGEEAAAGVKESIAQSLPVKRIGAPKDIAKSVAFLIDNSFVNGITLVVDGGHRLV
ncbi:SDR family oxidoreductase [Thalassovita taeanensis]|uniref:NAD(P)-dependent dehydrogenase, short-chain alcohol dehydrogenase family n=1 Tax=Thalassovita taeanensis TaxID=657014 RepID=A0A1H9BYP9_9RHOB|nr:SDR family oxidoreductase [Thalassovita taeanensis]SEP94049.1 NAD(P)-dependent dehydrogenase, short-chain alcohol dehydrogenase family [Thalassovita taeanensis]